jgi:hypothetical protein
MRIPLLAALVLAPSLAVATDPLDCNDMVPVVSEMLADRMQIPEYLLLDSAAAADTTLRMNYYHAERREYQRTVCSVMVRFNPIRFAEAERQAARMDSSRALQGLAKAASVGELALLANFPSGLKVGYRLELLGNGRT